MFKTTFIFALLFVGAALAADDDDVFTVTEDNFDALIKDNEFVLVEFFAPWCGHCKNLAPEYAKAATTLKKDGIVLGAVDATVHKDLGGRFEVRGYPTLKFFKNGEALEYKGGRTADTIVSWMRKATGPPAKLLSGKDAIEAFHADAKVAVVGFFASAESDEYKAFVEVAKKDEDNAFGYSVDAADAEEYGAKVPGVVLFKKFDEGKVVMEGDITSDSVSEFVATQSVPMVIPFTMEDVGSIFQSKLGKVAFLFTEEDNAGFTELAKDYRGKLVFAQADASVDRLNQHVGLEKSDFPKLIILTTGDQQMVKYPSDKGVGKDEMKAHIEDFLAGNAKAFYKSEPVPEPNDGPVTVVVGNNFDDIVMDESKSVLLEVYAPWCGHCKNLEPTYNKLGEAFTSNPNVVVAKMDGTANEVEGLSFRGFPTIKFYKAGKKTRGGEDYSGGRELDDFVSFLEDNSPAKDSHEEL